MAQSPDLPPLIETVERDYVDSGLPSTVAIAGHPLHPLIVTVPIAFLVAVPLSDIVYLLSGDNFWARAAFWLLGAGLAVSLVAALTGLMDFLRIERVRKRTAGWAHLILNVASIALSVVNLLIRIDKVETAIFPYGVILSVIVASLLGLSGWYGAELVYRHKVAVVGNGDPQI